MKHWRKHFFYTMILLFFCSCGVKTAPIAPESPLPGPRLDCSVQDPDCDKIDENYGK